MARKFIQQIAAFTFLFVFGALPCFANAQAEQFTFVEYNIAFVLGISFPVLLFSGIVAKKLAIKWYFPALLTTAILCLLYTLAYEKSYQSLFILTASSIFLTTIVTWPTVEETNLKSRPIINILKLASVIITSIYIASIWLISGIDAYFSWIISAGLIIIIAAALIYFSVQQNKFIFQRLAFLWLTMLLFSIGLYLWLNAQLLLNWFVVSAVLCYLAAMINGNWFMVSHIYQQLETTQERTKQQSHQQLYSYTHDSATQLPNAQQAQDVLSRYLKQSSQGKFAFILFKPINFHQVNSVLGHHNSDILLLQLAYNLQQHTQSNSQLLLLDNHHTPTRIARMQGLEFLVVLDLTAAKYADDILIKDCCEKIENAVPNALSFKSFSLNFSLSFGVVIANQSHIQVSELLARAQDALLEGQKNQQTICYFDEQQSLYSEQQLANMAQLKQDIDDENFSWQIHPQISAKDKRLVGFYLDVLWQQPQFHQQSAQLLTLEEFSRLAELSGDLYSLTKMMIKKAFHVLYSAKKLGVYLPVTISLSSKDLLEPDLGDFIETQLQNYSLSGKYLMISLNEDIVIHASARTKAMIDQLKAMDLQIAINDFSGSYEALRYIRKMAINQVRINCEQLVKEVENITDKAIINTLITLTRSMDIPLLGTNINHKNIESAFVALGGDWLQGDVVNSGIAIDSIESWIKQWQQLYSQTDTE